MNVFHHIVGCEDVFEDVLECVDADQSLRGTGIDQDAVVFGALDDVEVLEWKVVVVDVVLWCSLW